MDPASRREHPAPRVDLSPTVAALKTLQSILSLAQLEQLGRLLQQAKQCAAGALHADVRIRFVNGVPRFMGVETWEEANKT